VKVLFLTDNYPPGPRASRSLLAYGLDVVLRAAALAEPDEVQFVLVGDGAD
jgi:hypothetical protein